MLTVTATNCELVNRAVCVYCDFAVKVEYCSFPWQSALARMWTVSHPDPDWSP